MADAKKAEGASIRARRLPNLHLQQAVTGRKSHDYSRSIARRLQWTNALWQS